MPASKSQGPYSRAASRERIRHALALSPAGEQDKPQQTRSTGGQPREPFGRGNQSHANRRWVAKLRVEAPGRLEAEIAALAEHGITEEEDVLLVLQRAVEYEGQEGAIAAAAIDVAQEHGQQEIAEKIAAAHDWDLDEEAAPDPEIAEQVTAEVQALQNFTGLSDDDMAAIVDQATDFNGHPDALVAATFEALDEAGAHDLHDQLADQLEVDPDDVLAEAAEWADDDGQAPGDDPGVEDEARELVARYGGTEEDVAALLDLVEQHGGNPSEIFEQLADHAGVDLAELEAAAGQPDDDRPGAGGWDGGADPHGADGADADAGGDGEGGE